MGKKEAEYMRIQPQGKKLCKIRQLASYSGCLSL
jgi:hypothetical protein